MNTPIPSTRNSLLARLSDTGDVTAWSEFEAIYRPAVYRFARRRKLQPADAEDLTQQVMIAVAKKMGDWDSKSSGSFRAFLLMVTRNATLNHLTRTPRESRLSDATFIGDTSGDQSAEAEIDWEFRRATFRTVAMFVRHEFQSTTWQSFWLVAVQGRSAQDVAQELGLSLGAVYTNKSRVIKRIRDRIAEFDDDRVMEKPS